MPAPRGSTFHFGGKNKVRGSDEATKRALMRLRLLANSGMASRQYLSVSQKSPWQSMA